MEDRYFDKLLSVKDHSLKSKVFIDAVVDILKDNDYKKYIFQRDNLCILIDWLSIHFKEHVFIISNNKIISIMYIVEDQSEPMSYYSYYCDDDVIKWVLSKPYTILNIDLKDHYSKMVDKTLIECDDTLTFSSFLPKLVKSAIH